MIFEILFFVSFYHLSVIGGSISLTIIRTVLNLNKATYSLAQPPVFVDHESRSDSCIDTNVKCAEWANDGECQANAAWMLLNCKRSCQSCQGGK